MFFDHKPWFNLSRLILIGCFLLCYTGYFVYDKLCKKIEKLQFQIHNLEIPEPKTQPISDQSNEDWQTHLVHQELLQDLFHPIPGLCLQEMIMEEKHILVHGLAYSYAEMGQALSTNHLFKHSSHLKLSHAKHLPVIRFKTRVELKGKHEDRFIHFS